MLLIHKHFAMYYSHHTICSQSRYSFFRGDSHPTLMLGPYPSSSRLKVLTFFFFFITLPRPGRGGGVGQGRLQPIFPILSKSGCSENFRPAGPTPCPSEKTIKEARRTLHARILLWAPVTQRISRRLERTPSQGPCSFASLLPTVVQLGGAWTVQPASCSGGLPGAGMC